MVTQKLIHGEALEEMAKLEDKSVDLILADPPYGIDFQSGRRTIKHNKIENDKDTDWMPGIIEQLYRVAKNNTAHYLFCSWHKIDIFKQEIEKHFKIKSILVWEKNIIGMGDLKGDFAPITEFIIFFQKGVRHINGARDSNILRFAKTSNDLHPTQKPVDLLQYLIGKFSDVNDAVLDCFMGSGSTLVACQNTNRNGIGIELDKGYFKIAEKRIAEAIDKTSLFNNKNIEI